MKTIAAIEILSATRRICSDRDWQLLTFRPPGIDDAAFAGRVAQRLQEWQRSEGYAEITAKLIERAVVHEYCVLLHQAVGLENTFAQDRALIEVWNYVTPIIRWKLGDGDRALDCANEALRIVWQQRRAVHTPGAFLSWTAMIATRAVWAALREADRELALVDLPNDDDTGDADEVVSTCSGLEAITQPPELDDLAWWENIIRQCLSRMRAGADVFIGLVLQEQSVAEVAMRLGLSPANVHLIKLWAIKHLKRCALLLQALGRTPDLSSGAG
jgi:DNA-directed RNA polymerase specialized sigma24 family protein